MTVKSGKIVFLRIFPDLTISRPLTAGILSLGTINVANWQHRRPIVKLRWFEGIYFPDLERIGPQYRVELSVRLSFCGRPTSFFRLRRKLKEELLGQSLT